MMKNVLNILLSLIISGAFLSCKKKEGCIDPNAINYDPEAERSNGSCLYDTPTGPTPISIPVPLVFAQLLPPPFEPSDNPQTIEGVALGRKLFYDPVLSGNNTQACAFCHSPTTAFTDTARFSVGIDGFLGTRNSMPLFNLAWNYSNQFLFRYPTLYLN